MSGHRSILLHVYPFIEERIQVTAAGCFSQLIENPVRWQPSRHMW